MLLNNLRRERLSNQQCYLDHQFSREQKQKHHVHVRNSTLVDIDDEVQIERQQLHIAQCSYTTKINIDCQLP